MKTHNGNLERFSKQRDDQQAIGLSFNESIVEANLLFWGAQAWLDCTCACLDDHGLSDRTNKNVDFKLLGSKNNADIYLSSSVVANLRVF